MQRSLIIKNKRTNYNKNKKQKEGGIISGKEPTIIMKSQKLNTKFKNIIFKYH